MVPMYTEYYVSVFIGGTNKHFWNSNYCRVKSKVQSQRALSARSKPLVDSGSCSPMEVVV